MAASTGVAGAIVGILVADVAPAATAIAVPVELPTFRRRIHRTCCWCDEETSLCRA